MPLSEREEPLAFSLSGSAGGSTTQEDEMPAMTKRNLLKIARRIRPATQPSHVWLAWYDGKLWGPYKTRREAAMCVAGRKNAHRYDLRRKP